MAELKDKAARDAIENRLDINLLVEAGAGSGKTASLAKRMVSGIADGRYQVEVMAAVTFTRKAAAELRGRFQLELESRLEEEPESVRKERIRVALSHLGRLFAGTIHAFCAHLLRERPVEARVAPGFTELDEAGDQFARERAWVEFIDRETRAGAPLITALEATGIQPSDIWNAFDTLCRFPEVEFSADRISGTSLTTHFPEGASIATPLVTFSRRWSA